MNVTLAALALATGILNLLAFVYVVVGRLTRIESRVEILWCFLLRRGTVEAVQQGIMDHNSPLRIAPELIKKYEPIFQNVRNFHETEGKKLTDAAFAAELEQRFWPQIRQICLAENIHDGACLAMMLHSVRPDSRIFREWDEEPPGGTTQ